MGNDPIEAKLSECTRTLADDPEIQQENRAELRSHLLEARDALTAEGKSETEAAETACRQFGDSEDVAQALLQADFTRLKLRSKIRFFIRLAFLPLLLAAAYLTVDWRFFLTFLNSPFMNGGDPASPVMFVPRFIRSVFCGTATPDPVKNNLAELILMYHNFTEKELEILFLNEREVSRLSPDQLRELLKRHEDNPVFRTYIYSLLTSGDPKPELLAELAALDPENGYADLLAAGVLAQQALSFPVRERQQVTIKGREKMKQAMERLDMSLKKPYIRRCCRELAEQRIRLLNAAPDICGYLEQLEVGCALSLTDLTVFRNHCVASVLWGEQLEKEGRKAEAARYYDVWKKLLPLLNDSSFCLIEQLVVGSCLRYLYRAAVRRGDTARAEELKAPAEVVDNWRKTPKPDHRIVRRHGGLFTSMLLPALQGEITAENLKPDRQISYLMLETFLCAVIWAALMLSIIFHGIAALVSRLLKRPVFLLLPRVGEIGRDILLYLVLPLSLYLILTRIDWISGRGYAVMANGFRTAVFMIIFLIIPFLFVGAEQRRIRKRMKTLGTNQISRGQMGLNLLPVLLIALIVFGGFMRIWIVQEQRYWIPRDRFFYGSPVGFSRVEDDNVRFLKEQHARFLSP
ncbi:MAG: hypothetical protein IJS14_09465 [Lentisphaeria bacterium]|nr:hypothetical protein [Lentisphaeria bacterium]